MELTALTTGTVRIKTAMTRGRGVTPVRQARMLWDRNFTEEAPIHAWLIDHPEGPILVDSGELSSTADPPIARFSVDREQEIDQLLAGRGVGPDDLSRVVLTHLHGDHANGLARLPGAPVAASAHALRGGSRRLGRLGVQPTAIALSDGPFGAFPQSCSLTSDGRVVAVATPGHARGHIAVVVVQEGHHVILAGDSAYTQEQLLDLQVDGVSLSASMAVASMRRIIEHARLQPTVFLPSHDPGSATRLSDRTPLAF